MSVYTFTDAGGIIWNYTLDVSNNASIGNGSGSGATTLGSGLSGAKIIPSAVNGYTVTTIGDAAFFSCTGLTSLTIPNTVTSIGRQSFKTCSGLTSLTIPESVITIGEETFGRCYALSSVTISNTVTSIGNFAFLDATGLTSLNIPDSVTSIGSSALQGTSTALVVKINNGKFGAISPSTNKSFLGNNSVDFVLPQPTITITASASGSPLSSGSTTNNTSIALTFTSSQATTDFIAGDITLTNGTLPPSLTSVSSTVYTAIFTPTGQGVCTINVQANRFTAAGGNNNASNTFTWTVDTVSPSMTITSTTVTSGSTTNNKFIALTFTSTEATNNFVDTDISVTNGTLSNFASISGTVYNAKFTPLIEAACTINVAAGAYTDAAGNSNIAASFNWTFSTGWNSDMSANHLIKSYVKDFIDVSGSIVLYKNSNLYISGNTETAGNVSLNRLFVTADASFNRRIFVGGDVSMNGNVTMIGDLSMNGTVTKCNFNNSSIPKTAFSGAVPDGADYNTSKIVYDQTFQANDDVSMNGLIVAANNVKVSGNIVFGDGTVMNTYDNNVLSTNPTVFKSSTFTALDICGNLVAGSYATSSDYRIKTNIVELDETYTVDKLRPVKYFQTQINREKYGLIAHELQEHYPDLVIGEKDGTELQRVNYTGLIAILINEIKRMKRELTELETDVVVGR